MDELNATTLKTIYPRVIRDQFFRNAPLLAYMRHHCLVPFTGGAAQQHTFACAPLNGGFYSPGDNFNITVKQVLDATLFDMRYSYVDVSEYKENVQVLNKGPQAVFSIIDAKLRIGMNTISAINAVAMARHGRAAGGLIVDNRPKAINGWVEALNDGVTPGWDGNRFAAYGGATRNAGIIGATLNSVPLWCGTQAGAAAPVSYQTLLESFLDCRISGLDKAAEEPDLGVTNKRIYAGILERIQPQQRFAQEKDPIWGMTGLRFQSAFILVDDYFPSLAYGQNDAIIGNWLTSTVDTTGMSPASASNFPANTVCTVGEVFCWFNTKTFSYRITDDAEYGYGWSGFFPAQDNTRVAGQIKAATNLENDAPRLNKQLLGLAA